jgi:DNA invertase Pin-like site-specific DNA recombinase
MTPSGRMLLNFCAGTAEGEFVAIRDRLNGGWQQKARAGSLAVRHRSGTGSAARPRTSRNVRQTVPRCSASPCESSCHAYSATNNSQP